MRGILIAFAFYVGAVACFVAFLAWPAARRGELPVSGLREGAPLGEGRP